MSKFHSFRSFAHEAGHALLGFGESGAMGSANRAVMQREVNYGRPASGAGVRSTYSNSASMFARPGITLFGVTYEKLLVIFIVLLVFRYGSATYI